MGEIKSPILWKDQGEILSNDCSKNHEFHQVIKKEKLQIYLTDIEKKIVMFNLS